jgi:plasmid maintenance system antidote protein VapI
MKIELGRCLLEERLSERGMSLHSLAAALQYKPEKIVDFIENKRIMPLQTALSIADTIGCPVAALYEAVPASGATAASDSI